MTASIDSSGKLKYLHAEIDTEINAQGNRYVDLSSKNHDQLVDFGNAMELHGWDSFVRFICNIFCCCFGDEAIANMAREKLRAIPFNNREIELVTKPESVTLKKIESVKDAALPLPKTAPAPALLPVQKQQTEEIQPKKRALEAMALRYNNQDTVFGVELIRNGYETPSFRITHSSTYHTLQYTATESFTVPVSEYFTGTETRGYGSTDYVKLLTDQMKKMYLKVEESSDTSHLPQRASRKPRLQEME